MIRCKDILDLPSMKKAKVIAGAESLERIVRWVHVGDMPNVTDWVHGGELLIITGIGVKQDATSLLELIKNIVEKNLAGLLINIGPYIPEVPDQVIEYAESLGFPLMVIPWETKIVEVTEEICSTIIMKQMEEKSVRDLLENILFGDFDNPDTLINRGTYYGYDLKGSFQVAIIDIDDFAFYLKDKNITDEKRILEIKGQFQNALNSCLIKHSKKALSMMRSDSLVVLVPVKNKNGDEIKKLAEQIKNYVIRNIPGITVSIGIGNYYNKLTEIKNSLAEAERALQAAKWVHTKNKIFCYKDLGIYRLLFKVGDNQELESFCQETIGALLDYDKTHHTELLRTLESFLTENGNLVKTAQNMYIHRNTLKYRLQKIEELAEISLEDANQRINLHIGLMISKFLNLTK